MSAWVQLTHKDHPIWSILRIGVLIVVAFVVLRNNADNFDITEFKSIVEIAAAMGVVEVLKKRASHGDIKEAKQPETIREETTT